MAVYLVANLIFSLLSIIGGKVVANGGVLQIIDMRVPAVVENGSSSSVILDCDYVLRQPEKSGELVVQWYFQDQSSPVYQWIPGKRPQDLGILKGRLNLDYKASDDPFKRHRALEIMRPTVELSGDYRCKVATVEEEVSATKTMIVYAPARKLEMRVQQTAAAGSVNVTCWAEGVFPRPRLQLFRCDGNGMEIEGPPAELNLRHGVYDVRLHRWVRHRSLNEETIFECVLSIPQTPYQLKRNVIYYPEPAPVYSSGGQWTRLWTPLWACLSLLLLL